MTDRPISFVEQLFLNAVAPLITGVVTIVVFAILIWSREKRRAATQLLQIFYTSEVMLRARMLAHKYLIPGYDRSEYKLFANKTFDQIEEELGKGNEQTREDLIFLRALPSFFYLVDQAKRYKIIPADSEPWSHSYSYYWTMAFDGRRGTSQDDASFNDPLYEKFEWMLDEARIKHWKQTLKIKRRLADASPQSK